MYLLRSLRCDWSRWSVFSLKTLLVVPELVDDADQDSLGKSDKEASPDEDSCGKGSDVPVNKLDCLLFVHVGLPLRGRKLFKEALGVVVLCLSILIVSMVLFVVFWLLHLVWLHWNWLWHWHWSWMWLSKDN